MSDQLSLFAQENAPQSVSQVTRYIGQLFDRDPRLQDVAVEGEVSNYKRAASGHLYFTLKDSQAQLKCVMWKSDAVRLRTEPQQGAQLIAQGKIGVYTPTGEYQLYAKSLQAVGLGDLHRQFELLKAKLEAEGLFDSQRKRPIPAFPRRVGIVTSPDAAGFQDMLNILVRRYPSAQIILSPSLVQGAAAPPAIVLALQALYQREDVDVIVIARGGGSLEDLWCFNDERVVRAIAAAPIPTVTGVGHEID
jgi:exodeoxyribonuclease VII large subunit